MTAKSRYKRYFLANGTDARVRSHSSCNTPPRPSPSGAMAIVNCSTAWASRSTFMSTRAKSYCASYWVTDCPVLRLRINFQPSGEGMVQRLYFARRDGRAGDHEIGAGLEHGGRVRSGAPHLVPRHGAAENHAAPRRGAAIAHRERRARHAHPHRVGGGERAERARRERLRECGEVQRAADPLYGHLHRRADA